MGKKVWKVFLKIQLAYIFKFDNLSDFILKKGGKSGPRVISLHGK